MGKIIKEEKYYLSVLLSFMLNTVCSRVVDQTDLIMMNRFSPVSTAALVAIKNIAVIDFVVALAIVPIFAIIVKKGTDQAKRNELMGIYTKKYALITLFTVVLCALLYPLFIQLSVKDSQLKKLALFFALPLVLNIPAKMFQFLGSSFLCAIKKSNYVGFAWIAIAVLNFVLNTIFMHFMGSVGSLVSTIVITLCVCVFFFSVLQKETRLFAFFGKKASLGEYRKPILSECGRIIIERSASYLFFFFLLHYSSVAYISQIGIINEVTNLFLVPFIASMRSCALCFDENEKNSLWGKMCINLVCALLLSAAFLIFQKNIFVDLYKIEDTSSPIFALLAFSFPVLLFSEAFSNIMRGFLQFKLKQTLIFRLESCLNYLFFVPLTFFILKNNFEYVYPVVFAALYLLQALCYAFLKVSINRKQK
ncbi:MAG: hypothetical protein II811_04795 [Spirochaetaceae bacterium]|nr:hypothetical protein [Spirochaetaceae bacterium]